MQSNKIGIIDSGVGGVSILNSLTKDLPSESFIYLGDTAFFPYGDKDPSIIEQRLNVLINFLISKKVKYIIIACNSAASIFIYNNMKAIYTVPIIEIISPLVDGINNDIVKNILLLATERTIESQIYNYLLKHKKSHVMIHGMICNLLVECIESGWKEDDVTKLILKKSLKDISNTNFDAVVLGCTHFLSILDKVKSEMPGKSNILDTTSYFKSYFIKDITIRDLKNTNTNNISNITYYVTYNPMMFNKSIEKTYGLNIFSLCANI